MTANEVTPAEIIRRMNQNRNASEIVQRSINQTLLVAMHIKLASRPDWHVSDFIEELTTLLDSMVRDYEPLARPAPAPEVALPEPGTKDIA